MDESKVEERWRQLHLSVVEVPPVADRFHVQHVVLVVVLFPLNQRTVVAYTEGVVVSALQRFQEVVRPVLDLTELLFDSVLCLSIEVVEALTTTFGKEDVGHLHVVERDDVAVLDVLSGDTIVLEGPIGETRCLNHVAHCIAHQLALVEVVWVVFEELFEVLIHPIWNFDI